MTSATLESVSPMPAHRVSTNLARIFSIAFVIFLAYALQLRWTGLDNQEFNKIFNSYEYGGELINRQIGPIMLGVFLLAYSKYLFRSILYVDKILIAIAVIASISLFWSIDRGKTVVALMQLILSIGFVSTAVYVLGLKQTAKLYWLFGIALIVVTSLIALTGDRHVLMGGRFEGAWRGLFNHKNVYGPFVATIGLITIFYAKDFGTTKTIRAITVAMCIICLYFSKSSTAFVAFYAGIVAAYAALIPIKSRIIRSTLYIFAVIFSIISAIILFSYAEALAGLFDKDLTFSGRVSLWTAALSIAAEAPFGYGFGTFGGQAVIDAMQAYSGWSGARTAHNAYITVVLDIGWIGVILVVLWYLPKLFILKKGSMTAENVCLSALVALQITVGAMEISGGIAVSSHFIAILIFCIGAAINRRAQMKLKSRHQQNLRFSRIQ